MKSDRELGINNSHVMNVERYLRAIYEEQCETNELLRELANKKQTLFFSPFN